MKTRVCTLVYNPEPFKKKMLPHCTTFLSLRQECVLQLCTLDAPPPQFSSFSSQNVPLVPDEPSDDLCGIMRPRLWHTQPHVTLVAFSIVVFDFVVFHLLLLPRRK